MLSSLPESALSLSPAKMVACTGASCPLSWRSRVRLAASNTCMLLVGQLRLLLGQARDSWLLPLSFGVAAGLGVYPNSKTTSWRCCCIKGSGEVQGHASMTSETGQVHCTEAVW